MHTLMAVYWRTLTQEGTPRPHPINLVAAQLGSLVLPDHLHICQKALVTEGPHFVKRAGAFRKCPLGLAAIRLCGLVPLLVLADACQAGALGHIKASFHPARWEHAPDGR